MTWGRRKTGTVHYRLDPFVAGELGDLTELDTSTHPPRILRLDYCLDAPTDEDLIESFPAFLVSAKLARRMSERGLTGFVTEPALVSKSDNYVPVYGDVPHADYVRLIPSADPTADCWIGEDLRLHVSEATMALLRTANLSNCEVQELR